MDDTDFLLCKMLFMNSRVPYHDLADRMGLTTQAVHRRVQGLMEEHVIQGFRTYVALRFLGGTLAGIVGVIKNRPADEVMAVLARTERVVMAYKATSDYLFLNVLVKDLTELESLVEVLKKDLGMDSPGIGIMGTDWFGRSLKRPEEERFELSPLDYRIVNALHMDSRKSVVDVANELHVSAKTVKRHLEDMEREGAILYSIEWDPGCSNGIMNCIFIRMTPQIDKGALRSMLMRTYPANILLVSMFSNFPDALFGILWCPTAGKMNELCETLKKEKGVVSVTSYFVEKSCNFRTWRDTVFEERAKKA